MVSDPISSSKPNGHSTNNQPARQSIAIDAATRERLKAGRECLEAALYYRELEWSALALCPPDHVGVGKTHGKNCTSPGKAPWGPWKEFQDQLATPDQLRQKWRDNPGLNVGMAYGPVSGLIGVDVDGAGGGEALSRISGGDVPDTLEFETGGGGRRLLYRIPPGAELRTTYEQPEPGQEVRFQAKGAQTAMPPSRHESGRRYRWREGHGPGEIEPAMAPDWLLEQLKPSRSVASVNGKATPVGEAIHEGARDCTLMSLAGTMRRRGMTRDAIFAALKVENEEKCQPPLEEMQVWKIANSAASYPAPHGTAHRDGESKSKSTTTEPEVEIFTAADLLTTELPEPKYAVPGILPEGLNLLAGKPKLGKSWLALNIALAIALGGKALGSIDVEEGDVLYLALEDSKHRLKRRLAKLLHGQDGVLPRRLHLARAWPRQDKGGLVKIAEWLTRHPDARLVVIDTWAKFRPPRLRGSDAYEDDYRQAAGVKTVADEHNSGIWALHHCRKMNADDPLDEVSGTLGLTGAADGVTVLRRQRGQCDATLFVTGRDIDEQDIALKWDPVYALWSVLGRAEEYRLTRERAECMDLLRKEGRALSPSEAGPLLGKTPNACKLLMWKLERGGWLKTDGAGKYFVPLQPAGWPEEDT
jgi:hypothetical protein